MIHIVTFITLSRYPYRDRSWRVLWGPFHHQRSYSYHPPNPLSFVIDMTDMYSQYILRLLTSFALLYVSGDPVGLLKLSSIFL